MKEYLIRLFNYNHWANEILTDLLLSNSVSDEYIYKLLSHNLNAQYIWLHRLDPNKKSNVELWDIHTIEKLKEMNDEIAEFFIDYLTEIRPRDIAKKISVANLKGETFINSIGDIMIHIGNHAAHHRGQISSKLREMGVDPPNFNYITYARSFPEFW